MLASAFPGLMSKAAVLFSSKTKTRPTDLFKEQETSGFNYRTERMAP